MPFATSVPLVMPPKMLIKIAFTFSSELMTSSAAAITSALAPPPMSRKLAARPPTWFTTSSVLMARPAPLAMMPTLAVEADVLQALRPGELLALVELLGRGVLVPLGMAERGVAVEAHLGVERVHTAVGREDQRVDLGEVAVALDVAAVQLRQDLGGAVDRRGIELRVDTRSGGPARGSSPSTGSIQVFTMASGSSSATCSISTPPRGRHHAAGTSSPSGRG